MSAAAMTTGPTPFRHFIITRYSLRNADRAWHERRLELFRRVYLPSLESQNCRDFFCLLLADREFPDQTRRQLLELLPDERYRLLQVKSRGPMGCDERDFIGPLLELADDAPYVVTTRMDSDDAIACDFVSRLQERFQEQACEVINFRRGLFWQSGRVCAADCPSNMFLSVISARSPLVHCYARPHVKMQSEFPTRNLAGAPAWLHLRHASAYSAQTASRLVELSSSYPDSRLPAVFSVNLNGL
jgi:hypothetical protein